MNALTLQDPHSHRIGQWHWHPRSDRLSECGFSRVLLNYRDDTRPACGRDLLALTHPDDVARLTAALSACAAGVQDEYHLQHRIRDSAGNFHWIFSQGRVLTRTPSGRVRAIGGIYVELSLANDTRDPFASPQSFLELILDHIPARVFWRNTAGVYLGCNKAFASDVGLPNPAAVVGLTDTDFRWSEHKAAFTADDAAVLATNRAKRSALWSVADQDGRERWVEATKVPLHDRDDRPAGILAAYVDVTDRQQKSQRLDALAKALALGSGERLLHALTKTAVELSGATCAYIATVNGNQAQVRASYPAGIVDEEYCYALDKTPCEITLRSSLCIHEDGVQAAFPDDQVLKDLGINAYAARLLTDKAEQALGMLVLLHRERFLEAELLPTLLEIVGASAASELIRDTRSRELDHTQLILRTVLNNIPQGVYWKDEQSRYLGCNPTFANDAGLDSADQLVGRLDSELSWKHLAPRLRTEDLDILSGRSARVVTEDCITDRSGDAKWVEKIKVPFLGADGTALGVLGTIHDISARKRSEAEIERLAFFDPLTQLPNRRYFKDRLGKAVASALSRAAAGALLYLDLDHFKRINDTLGHAVGDRLLIATSQRIRALLRQEDMLARLGGDEFVVLLDGLSVDAEQCAHQAQVVAKKIVAQLALPFAIDNEQLYITTTIGIAVFPEHHDDVDELVKMADTAMYRGKSEGRNTVFFFKPELLAIANDRLRIENALRTAISRDEFRLHYQPQFDTAGKVVGAEALLRWRHPELGAVAPDRFIPIAEDSGLIVEIGQWVIEQGLAAIHRWEEAGVAAGDHLAINVSHHQFRSPTFVEEVLVAMGKDSVSRGKLVLELTETAAAARIEDTIAKMNQLRASGVSFSIDDFGVGYSSLAYLARLPLRQLKIDRSFINDIENDRSKVAIVATLLTLGQHLDLTVVAEGVESQAQWKILGALGCNLCQGYLFSRPLPENEFIALCRAVEGTGMRPDSATTAPVELKRAAS